jgi:hypothetical protein
MRDDVRGIRKTPDLLNSEFPPPSGTEGTKPEIGNIGKHFLLRAPHMLRGLADAAKSQAGIYKRES